MTKFIELTIRDTKLTINTNNILQFYRVEPNDTETKIIFFDGVQKGEAYVQESYEDLSRALNVVTVSNDEIRKKKAFAVYSTHSFL